MLNVPAGERTPEQKLLAKEAEDQLKISWDELVSLLSPEDREKRAELRRQMHRIELDKPDPPPTAFAVANIDKDPPPTYILKAGDYKQKLGEVSPGFITVIAPNSEVPTSAAGRRSALANWITSPDHPLTARVMVNRIWQMRMGTGLVKTPNDFGLLGGQATNRKLLDWLATEFVARNWSVKSLDRMILLSSAYQQRADNDPAKAAIDPDNNLHWRMNRRRMDAETLRDSILAVSGLLNPRIGGKPVRIPIEPEIYDLIFTEGEPDNLWPVTPDKAEHYRRSIYLLNKRTLRLPMLANFDQPDAMTSCPVRPASTHPLQALSLMNSEFMQKQSAAFAARLEHDCRSRRDCEVKLAYKLALNRAPKPTEVKMARRFFGKGEPLTDFCLALLNRNEFIYVP